MKKKLAFLSLFLAFPFIGNASILNMNILGLNGVFYFNDETHILTHADNCKIEYQLHKEKNSYRGERSYFANDFGLNREITEKITLKMHDDLITVSFKSDIRPDIKTLSAPYESCEKSSACQEALSLPLCP